MASQHGALCPEQLPLLHGAAVEAAQHVGGGGHGLPDLVGGGGDVDAVVVVAQPVVGAQVERDVVRQPQRVAHLCHGVAVVGCREGE